MLVKTTCDIARKEYVPEDLKTAKYAFIRIDTFKRPPPKLSPAYSGPHLILQHRENAYQLIVDRKITWVSTDRLKLACIPDCDLLP